jgi:glyoxylase-like metal-dependent hydrolase (beta-lactamase superfamily II)
MRLGRFAIALAMTAGLAGAAIDAQIKATYGSVVGGYEVRKLAEGVYAFLAPDSKTPFVSGNSLVVIGREAALVVDTGHVPALARRMIGDIKHLTSVPVTVVVNTHWHFDHIVGNGEFHAAFPGAAIVSTRETAAQIRAQVPDYAAKVEAQVAAGGPAIRQMLTDGKRPDGTPLSPDDREFFEAELHDFTTAVPAIREMKYAPPTLTFDGEMTFDLGQRTVRVMHLGRGNTAGDAVVYVPDARVVATGDLVVAPVPYATASFMFDWPETMRKLMELPADAIVPGHGPVMHDWRYAHQVVDVMRGITDQVERAAADGLSLEDTRKRVDAAAYRDALAGADPFQRRIFNTFFLPGAVKRAYDEAIFRLEK